MPCKPILPTGEKQAQRFDPPQFWPVNKPADLQRALQRAMADIKADLAGVHAAITEPPQVTRRNSTPGVVDATAGSVVRVTPPAAGITVLLPAARLANKGKDVAVLVEGSGGPVTVRAVGGTVNGVATVTLNGVGLRVFRSDGGEGGNTGGWWIVGQSSASPGSVAIGAGTNTTQQGTVVFANANNVTFGMNTAGVVTASAAAAVNAVALTNMPASISQSFSNATDTVFTGGSLFFQYALGAFGASSTNLSLANVQFALNSNSLIGLARVRFLAGVSQVNAHNVSLIDSNGFSWGAQSTTIGVLGDFLRITQNYAAPRAVSAGTQSMSVGTLVFANGGGVTWGMSGSSQITASVAAAPTMTFGSVGALSQFFDISATRTIVTGSTLGFQNLAHMGASSTAVFQPNVFFGLGNGDTIQAVARPIIRIGTVTLGAPNISFVDGSGVTWGAQSTTLNPQGEFVLISASVGAAGGGLTNIRLSAGTTSNLASAFTFADSNNFSWGLNAGTITAQPFMLVSHVGGNSANVTRLAFSNASNVTWSVSTAASAATVFASVAAGGGGGITAVNISAGTTNTNVSNWSFADSNNFSWGINGSTITARPFLFVTDTGGTSANITRLAFGNLNNITFGISTAASAATMTASFDIGGTPFFSLRVTANGSSTNLTGGGGANTAQLRFDNSNNMTFGLSTAANAALITASYEPFLRGVSAGGGAITSGTLEFVNANGVTFTRNGQSISASVLTNRALSYYPNTTPVSTQLLPIGGSTNTMWLAPFNGGVVFPANMTASTAEFMVNNVFATNGTSTYGFTMRGGVYTLNNSTQLTLVNSFSSSFSATTEATATRNSLVGGGRWITVGTGAWSSSPVFSEGVQYWMGLCMNTANMAGIPNGWVGWNAALLNVGQVWQGEFNQSATLSSGAFGPFWGPVATSSPPGSIALTQVQNIGAGSAKQIFWQFRNNIGRF